MAGNEYRDVIIIGAGFSGIGAAILLDEAGFNDYAILEEGDGVGGAWHWNTYPGVAVDIPSLSYQFSFAQRADWSRLFAPGAELKAYAEELVDSRGLRGRIHLNSKVTGMSWDEDIRMWSVTTAHGVSYHARNVIGATGILTRPKLPDIAGIESFEGTVLHTARWDHDVDLTGKRVAVIGTGASAVQVVPSIAPSVAHLTVFQRTPIWCLPKPDHALGVLARTGLKVPGVGRIARLVSQTFVEANFPALTHYGTAFPALPAAGEALGRAYLRYAVRDPQVRERLTPHYGLGCKRPSLSNTYLPTFNRDNVALQTSPIEAVTGHSVRTIDGADHPIDVLILATGFQVFDRGNTPPFPVVGVDGQELGAWWEEHGLQSFQGISVPGFPNYFSILGPYAYNGSSYFNLIEVQMAHIVRCLKKARASDATRVEVTPAALKDYMDEMFSRRKNQIFFNGSCTTANSYYFDKDGNVPFRASPTLEMMWTARRYAFSSYSFA